MTPSGNTAHVGSIDRIEPPFLGQSLSALDRALVDGVSNTHRFKPHLISLILSSSHGAVGNCFCVSTFIVTIYWIISRPE